MTVTDSACPEYKVALYIGNYAIINNVKQAGKVFAPRGRWSTTVSGEPRKCAQRNL